MVANPNYLSPEEYLALERKAETKSEYLFGVAYAMSGGSPRHSLIAMNLGAEIHTQLRGTPCRVFNSDLRIHVPDRSKYLYPDLTIACGEIALTGEEEAVISPQIIIEVLSESTASYDRGKKFQYYQEFESFREYLLVSQDEPIIERFVRQPSGDWLYTKFEGLEAALNLTTVDCRLELKDVYAKVF